MKKTISVLSLALILLSQVSYAQDYNFTFDTARQKALLSSKIIALQKEIKESISKKNELQKQDYTQNNPNYEYNGITKTEVYDHTYKTYDYKKILKNVTQEEKSMIIDNEKKTMNLFIDLINDMKDIKNKKFELQEAKNLVTKAELKFKKGLITNLALNDEKNNVSKIQTELITLEKKLQLDDKKFKQHLNLSKNDKISLELTEPTIHALLPENAIEITEANKKEFSDLREELKELQDDMKWIETNYSNNYFDNIEKQEKLIEQKKQDISKLKSDTLYNYDKSYYEILIKANEIELDKINKLQLEMKKKKLEILYKKGSITKNEINKIENQINENIQSQNKKSLEIRWLTFNYDKNIVL